VTGGSSRAIDLTRDRRSRSIGAPRRRGYDAAISHPRGCRRPRSRSIDEPRARAARGAASSFACVLVSCTGRRVTHRRQHDVTRAWRCAPPVIATSGTGPRRVGGCACVRERERERGGGERDEWKREGCEGARRSRAVRFTIASITQVALRRYYINGKPP